MEGKELLKRRKRSITRLKGIVKGDARLKERKRSLERKKLKEKTYWFEKKERMQEKTEG